MRMRLQLCFAMLLLACTDASRVKRDEMERVRPMLASQWIASGFGREQDTASFNMTIDPTASPAYRRGAFSDSILRMVGTEQILVPDAPTPRPSPRSVAKSIMLPTLDGDFPLEIGGDASYLVAIYYPEDKYQKLWFNSPLDPLFR